MQSLPSYVCESWVTPDQDDHAAPVCDAVTGEQFTTASSLGVDVAAAIEHARLVGGPALRALTFTARADLLDAVAVAVRARRDSLYELSARSGATLSDARFDVDGGIRVLRDYAVRARGNLPDARSFIEGPAEVLHGEHFQGLHVLTSRLGLMLQINAFNFPVWAPLEKLAQALLAGLPTIVKPATSTSYLTVELVRIIADAGVLPAGAMQLVCGSIPSALGLLDEQDVVSFTGSAGTANLLRAHPNVIARAVHFNAEADSVNAIVLGPDVDPGSELFEAFLGEVAAEMTVKAGQKCTAIRRVIAPAARRAGIVDALVARLSEVRVGRPGADGVSMGSLASLGQREDVRRAVDQIAAAGRVVFGDPFQVEVIGADPERGAFLAPILLECDAGASAPHDVEPFGPVATLMAYQDRDEPIGICARGRGSLAATVVSDDPAWTRDMLGGLAPWHGRVHVLDSVSAAHTTGHGSPLPALSHGGPGRAGGGAELGGLRGVFALMNRTAVQGSPQFLRSL